MTKRIWVQLLIGDTAHSPTKVEVDETSDIDDLKKVIKVGFPLLLYDVEALELQVYGPGVGKPTHLEQSLNPKSKLESLNLKTDEELRVVALPPPRTAQQAFLLTPQLDMFALKTEFTPTHPELFRSYFDFYIRENKTSVFGKCDRSNNNIEVDLVWPVSYSTVWSALQSALQGDRDLFNDLSKQIKFCRLPALPQIWTYQPSESSPRLKHWNDAWVNGTELPSTFPAIKKAPSDIVSVGTQTAHIVSLSEYKQQALWLLCQVSVSKKQANEILKSFDQLVLTLPVGEHNNFDRLDFFFAWQMVKQYSNSFSATLIPVMVKPTNDDVLPLQHITLDEIPEQQAQIYHHAFVLRKYLTLAVRNKLYCPDDFVQEWKSTDFTSNCFLKG
eukprot:c13004_g1_i4.p1 GENE.c13004_g1_i4~~c13004_g1_i4.p1  ORF type:complete len:420 (-),score=70.69 c13004_g1_i4:118-1278(-)